jgi:N-dimethylarginine dimethylaminohydrolase
MLRILDSLGHLRAALDFPEQKVGKRLYMIDPDAFAIVQAINPHMQAADGSLNVVNKARARDQWNSLKKTYESIGMTVDVLRSAADCPDMVFCANQTFPFYNSNNEASVVLSNMASDSRHAEVAPIQRQLLERGIHCQSLSERGPESLFEGMGDALWVPGRKLICGGYGYRTKREIYEQLETITQTAIVLFELVQPKFYHLDTCLSILDERTVLACREGFLPRDWQKLQQLFERVIEVPLAEADAPGFACNAHCPDGKHVILQRGNTETCAMLEKSGFVPLEIDTDEFIKSGGSVFCMKLQTLWD